MVLKAASIDTTAVRDDCSHHWVIATPNGAVSDGRCKICGRERVFRNSQEDLLWDSDSFSLNGSRYRRRRIGAN